MDVADRIDRLFEDEELGPDPAGALELMAAQVADHGPRLVMIAARGGEPRFVHAVDGRRYGRDEVRALALAALGAAPRAPAAPKAPGYLYPVYRRDGFSDVLLLWCAREPTRLGAPEHQLLARTGSLLLMLLALRADRDRLETRVRQLENEHSVLSASHDQTVSELLESREEAARLERNHVQRLEAEVERRSADLRTALDQAELANRTKATFLATMSHEIRTPLTAILGYAELLRSQSLEPREIDEYTGIIQANGRNLLEILNDVLEYSRMESRSLAVAESRFSIFELVDEVAASFRPEAEAKGLTVLLAADTDDPDMSSDRGRVMQVLTNLVQNAVKFTDNGEIRIKVSARSAGRDDYVVLEVRDTGIGMSTTQVDRIFEAFTQIHQGSTRRFTGAGLGLAISRHLAQLLGGDITVDSREGCGSTFRATLLRTLSGVGAAPDAPSPGVAWEDDELLGVLREFLHEVPERLERLRRAATVEEWSEAVAEAHRLGEEADVLQVEPLRRATSGLILAADARDPGRVEQAAQDLLEVIPQVLPG